MSAEEVVASIAAMSSQETPAPEPVSVTVQAEGAGGATAAAGGNSASNPAVPETQRPAVEAVAPAPVATTIEQPRIEPGHVPIQTMLDEREKRQRYEAEVKALKERVSQFETQQVSRPNIQDDPEAYARFQSQENATNRLQTVFDISEVMARDKHTDEQVNHALEWGMTRAQQSPSFAAEYIRQKHPVDWVIKQQRAEGIVQELSKDETAYITRRARELGLIPGEQPAAPAAQPAHAPAPNTPQPVAPPRSLATQPSAGGGQNSVPVHPLAGLEALDTALRAPRRG